MNVKEVTARVERIRDLQGDPEVAHSDEDVLRDDVLQAIADGAKNARKLAAAALATNDIEFPRWCA